MELEWSGKEKNQESGHHADSGEDLEEASAPQCQRLQRAAVREGMESIYCPGIRKPVVVWQGQGFLFFLVLEGFLVGRRWDEAGCWALRAEWLVRNRNS